jgi:hypothetical protein
MNKLDRGRREVGAPCRVKRGYMSRSSRKSRSFVRFRRLEQTQAQRFCPPQQLLRLDPPSAGNPVQDERWADQGLKTESESKVR